MWEQQKDPSILPTNTTTTTANLIYKGFKKSIKFQNVYFHTNKEWQTTKNTTNG